jgi:hypothetical protein
MKYAHIPMHNGILLRADNVIFVYVSLHTACLTRYGAYMEYDPYIYVYIVIGAGHI